MRLQTENIKSLVAANGTTCVQYSARDKDKGRRTVECKSTCKANWQDVNGVVTKITSLGCFDNDHYQSQCSDEFCKPFLREELRSSEQKHREPSLSSDEKIHVNICCCHGKMCNSDLRSRDTPKHVVTSTQNTVLLQGIKGLHPTLAPSAVADSATRYSPLWLVLIACGILLGIIAYVIKRVHVQNSRESDLTLKRIGTVCRDQCPTKFTGPDHIDNVQLKEEQRFHHKGGCGGENNKRIEIAFHQPLGHGKFGTVYLANTGNKQFLCYKDFRFSGTETPYLNEIEVNNLLQRYDHPNLVRYFGQFNVGSHVGILTEFCGLGSLRNYLDKNTIGFDTCCSFLQNLTCAVAFLHSSIDSAGRAKSSVAHRDLKSANIMVRENLTLAVGDFGVALSLDSRHDDQSEDVLKAEHLAAEGTPFYAAPEVLDLSINLNRFRTSLKHADVYSMALVMWEIVNRCTDFYGNGNPPPPHCLPYQHDVITTSQLIDHVVSQAKRPRFGFQHLEESCDNSSENGESNLVVFQPLDDDREFMKVASYLIKTIRECWDKDEEARLSAACVEDRILSIPFLNCLDRETVLMESSV